MWGEDAWGVRGWGSYLHGFVHSEGENFDSHYLAEILRSKVSMIMKTSGCLTQSSVENN